MNEQQIIVTVRSIRDVARARRGEFYRLFSSCYDNTDRTRFEADFSQKDWCIEAALEDGQLAGFSTLQIRAHWSCGEPAVILYSGDTVVDRVYWHRNLIAPAFVHCMFKVIEMSPGRRRYWLLLSKGFRTYRFLPVYFKAFQPAPLPLVSDSERLLLDDLGVSRFGNRFDSARGVVSFDGKRDFLAPSYADIPARLRARPEVDYFLRARNAERSDPFRRIPGPAGPAGSWVSGRVKRGRAR